MTDIEKADKSTAQSARGKNLMLASGVTLLTAIGATGYYMMNGQNSQSTDNAYVNGHVVDISPRITGSIAKIYVDNTDRVQAGHALVDIDQSDVNIELAAAQADLARIRRNVTALFTQQKQSDSKIHAEKVLLTKAQADFNARRGLADQDLITKEELRHAADAVKVAQANVDQAIAAQQQVLAHIQGTDIDHHPEVLLAKERVEKALLNMQRSNIIAPVSGMVAQRTVQLGEQVAIGQKLLSIIPLDQMWIDANFKETQLSGICAGQAAEVTIDSYGRKIKYRGKVQDIMVGSGSAFSVLPAQNATGNWIKVVQRVPVRIQLDPKQLAQYPLRIGLSAEVKVDTTRCNPSTTIKNKTPSTPPLQSLQIAKPTSFNMMLTHWDI
ncbi:efflux RND transporter periplasmic adaptor subunit [Acinetobacter larvae]|uniref:HlyD family secretion protein n=1 Tax=Acinetobacter larvae TaxID=1789224 RepID=A0A1B2M1M9_9GAMM|nr:efflux RND transporter periplasmic adaptor subunit [Acinetobacter larvae]AOA58923.1 HlyD family secretion protein [Acinetobacter larvae]